VEKVVRDTTREQQLLERERQLLEQQKDLQAKQERLAADCQKLSEEKKSLKNQVDQVSDRNASLVGANAELGSQLAKERDRRQRLERVIPKEQRQFSDRTLKIFAHSAFYDRKEGYVAFEGNVNVEDEQYFLCSNRAFVFTDPDQTNSVKYLVALDNVAVTNGTKRAYGTKASYYRQTGMVVLHGDAKTPAIVRDESRVDDQQVIGEKIKFWINSEQVEVLKARISAPMQGTGDIKKGLLGR